MGTPVLTNGNMMMFHSYETELMREFGTKEQKSKASLYAKKASAMLVEAAKSAIETSDGTIDVVMMTALHTGDGYLDMSDKIRISPYFQPYTEGEFKPYQRMYTSPYHSVYRRKDNIILAARVGDKVLTGKELVEWFQTECHGDKEELIQKLNLHFGPRETQFDFGERKVKQEIVVKEDDVSSSFVEAYQEVSRERDIYSLALERKKLKEKASEDELIKEDYRKVQGVINQHEMRDEIMKASSLPENELRMRIASLSQREQELYSGSDFSLMQYMVLEKKKFKKQLETKFREKHL